MNALKTLSLLGTTAVVSFFSAGAALASIDLKNEDSTSYDLKIHSGSTTLNTSISSNTRQTSVCSSACKIEVVGVGTVELSDADADNDVLVIIEGGRVRADE